MSVIEIMAVGGLSAALGFLLCWCRMGRKQERLHGQIRLLSATVEARDRMICQMALSIRNIALLMTEDGRSVQDIIAIISRTEAMMYSGRAEIIKAE